MKKKKLYKITVHTVRMGFDDKPFYENCIDIKKDYTKKIPTKLKKRIGNKINIHFSDLVCCQIIENPWVFNMRITNQFGQPLHKGIIPFIKGSI